jgi:hypothetical protein
MLHITINSQNKNETLENVTPSLNAYCILSNTLHALLTPTVLHHKPDNALCTKNVEL